MVLATQRHLFVSESQIKPTSNLIVAIVLCGNVEDASSNPKPQVIARAVPLSVNEILIESPSTGVPLKLVVILVISVLTTVKWNTP